MKYMIFLVKHHDGFCLYDTQAHRLQEHRPRGGVEARRDEGRGRRVPRGGLAS